MTGNLVSSSSTWVGKMREGPEGKQGSHHISPISIINACWQAVSVNIATLKQNRGGGIPQQLKTGEGTSYFIIESGGGVRGSHYWRGGGYLGGGGTGLLTPTDDISGGINTVSSPRPLTCWQHFLTINPISSKANREITPNHARVPVDVTEYNLKDSWVSLIRFSISC